MLNPKYEKNLTVFEELGAISRSEITEKINMIEMLLHTKNRDEELRELNKYLENYIKSDTRFSLDKEEFDKKEARYEELSKMPKIEDKYSKEAYEPYISLDKDALEMEVKKLKVVKAIGKDVSRVKELLDKASKRREELVEEYKRHKAEDMDQVELETELRDIEGFLEEYSKKANGGIILEEDKKEHAEKEARYEELLKKKSGLKDNKEKLESMARDIQSQDRKINKYSELLDYALNEKNWEEIIVNASLIKKSNKKEESEPEVAEKPETEKEESEPEVAEKPETGKEESEPEVAKKPESEKGKSEPEVAEKPESEKGKSEPEVAEKPESEKGKSEPEVAKKPESEKGKSEPEVAKKPESEKGKSEPEGAKKPQPEKEEAIVVSEFAEKHPILAKIPFLEKIVNGIKKLKETAFVKKIVKIKNSIGKKISDWYGADSESKVTDEQFEKFGQAVDISDEEKLNKEIERENERYNTMREWSEKVAQGDQETIERLQKLAKYYQWPKQILEDNGIEVEPQERFKGLQVSAEVQGKLNGVVEKYNENQANANSQKTENQQKESLKQVEHGEH